MGPEPSRSGRGLSHPVVCITSPRPDIECNDVPIARVRFAARSADFAGESLT